MKRLLAIPLTFTFIMTAGLLTQPASAFQNQSFTYTSTAGMFEDMYDYFIYSPAYLPGFQKNAFWGQLSNLQSQNDQFANGAANGDYLIGGQLDMAGMGRAGAMYDWTGVSTPQSFTDANGIGGKGYSDSTKVSYSDLDGDGQIDSRSETYTHEKMMANNYSNDLYLAYGLGQAFGSIDLGAAVRWQAYDNSPTYVGANSFDEVITTRNYNLLTGQEEGPSIDHNQTGSLDYGYSNWTVELAGRTKLMPDLDLVANVGPILSQTYNKYTYDSSDFTDNSPANPAVISQRSVTEHDSGFYTGAVNYYPGSGIGVLANVRADYTYNPGIIFTGMLGFSTAPETLDSGKNKYESVTDNKMTNMSLVNDTYGDTTQDYTGTTGNVDMNAKLRAQFIAKGWKLGLGVNFDYASITSDITSKISNTTISSTTGNADPANDQITTTTYDYTQETKSEATTNTIEFPIGVVFNILDNLPLRFGVKHTIQITNAPTINGVITPSTSTQITQCDPTITRTVDGNGNLLSQSVSQTANTNTQEQSNSPFSVINTNTFYYGLSWWPFPQVQIDLAGFTNVLVLTGYKASFNFYF